MTGQFVSFEGIDGAGKSTMAAALTQRLQASGVNAVLIQKSDTAADDPFVRGHFAALRAALWDYPRDADIGRLGNRHWLHLLVAWYAALDASVVQEHLQAGRWVVTDGWLYKYLARFALKPEIGEAYAAQCFEGLSRPDTVYYLDVAPCVAFNRRAAFQPSELGAYDGVQGDPESCYVAYQQQVQAAYRRFARRYGWHHINATERRPCDVLEELASSLLAPSTA